MTLKLRSFMSDRATRAITSRLALIVVMIGISFYFSTENARSAIYAIYFYPSTPGVGCMEWGINTFEECSVTAFCTELDATNELLDAGVYTGVFCPGGEPWVLNQARMTGAVGSMGVAGYAKSTTIPGFRNMGEASRTATCLHVVVADATYFPENCYGPNIPIDPNICFTSECNHDVCDALGYHWNFTNQTCHDLLSGGGCLEPPPIFACDEQIPPIDGCPYWLDTFGNLDCGPSPILIDITGDGLH